jgi:hypothetical protein
LPPGIGDYTGTEARKLRILKKNEKQREIRSLQAAYGISEEDDRYFGGPQGD